MTTTTEQHLKFIALSWPDLSEALGQPPVFDGFGRGLRGYLAALEQYDVDEAAALRALERDPAQLGERPIPIRLRVHETMHLVRAVLLDCADVIAASVQRTAMSPAPASWPAADRERRDVLAAADAADRRRWSWTGSRPDAPYTALWLLARVRALPGPFAPLSGDEQARIAGVAAGAVQRIEAVLDIGSATARLAPPCPTCGGQVDVHGGAGASPLAHCTGPCGGIWTEQGSAVA